MRDESARHVLCIELDDAEWDFFCHMRAVGGFRTDADCGRQALYRFAKHLDVPIGQDVFRLRWTGKRRDKASA